MAGHRRGWWSLLRGSSALLVLGLTAAALCFAASWIPTAEKEAYLSAGRCDDPTVAAAADCRDVVLVSVVEVGQTTAGQEVVKIGLPEGPRKVAIATFLWNAPSFAVGQRVDAELWRGKVTRLSGPGGSFVTLDSPLNVPTELRSLATALVVATLVLVSVIEVTGITVRRRRRRVAKGVAARRAHG